MKRARLPRRPFVLAFGVGLSLALAGCAAKADAPVTSPATVSPVSTLPAGNAASTAVSAGPIPWPKITLVRQWSGLDVPVGLTSARDGSGRIFIVEKTGRIRIVKSGALVQRPFLDIASRVSKGAEQGLLGLAFPPRYAAKRRFYIYYTDTGGTIRIARVKLTTDSDVANPASIRVVLSIPHPRFPNHNGGQIAFGPDGYLYIGVGDGGGGGDPYNRAQNLGDLHGKLLRIDVESGSATYSIPRTNPFLRTKGARREIWARGLRNPWRFGFDRRTRDLWIADVGQDAWEEIDLQRASSRGGANYGWRKYEGTHAYPPGRAAPSRKGLTFPVTQYPHPFGECVTGGYVYRGPADRAMQGLYLFGDFTKGQVFGLRLNAGKWQRATLAPTSLQITSFGEDEAGELYVCDWSGVIYRVRGAPR